jgi:hypothetical protein
MLIGRRPLRHVAMLGATGFVAGVAKTRMAQRRAAQEARRTQARVAASPSHLVGTLRELAVLRDEGVLTPEEFEAAKRKLLAA